MLRERIMRIESADETIGTIEATISRLESTPLVAA